MDGMDGMDSDGSGYEYYQLVGVNFIQNYVYVCDYWYFVVGVVGFLFLLCGIGYLQVC